MSSIHLWSNKQVIFGDGADMALVGIDGVAGQVVTYTVNNLEYTEPLPDIGTGNGRVLLEVTCDTPNMTIVVTCEGQSAVIYSVGVP